MSIGLDRLQLGHAAVLSPTRAAELLPARETEALRWLRERGLIREVPGLGEVVVWGEVVAVIVAQVTPTIEVAPPSARAATPFRRARL